MQEAWIQLQCPDCMEDWEANPADLPEPGEEMACDHCSATHPISEFTKTKRGFEILREFHEE